MHSGILLHNLMAKGKKMKRFIFTSLILFFALVVNAGNTSCRYTPDNTTIFKNPERGYTEELSKKVSASSNHVVKGNISDSWGNSNKKTLALVLYNFNKLKAQELPKEILTGFDEDMAELRKYGLKCVLRFAYTESQSDNVDATPEWVDKHLEQLSQYLIDNADVIYTIEAGFVGSWGEWYYTKNYGNESQHMNANRRKVIESLFKYAPTDRFILFRYPMLKTEYLSDKNPLTESEGFSGTIKARMGCHNDAFLNNWGNDGTYASNSSEDDPKVRQYIATETLYVPNGGETNVEEDDLAEKVYTKAPSEMSKYHWSFCGQSYATQVTRRWKNSGIFDTLNVHMGYRYNLINGLYSDKAAPGGKANITILVRNVGYAPIYNERPVYIVLKNSSNTYSIKLQADPRRWLPNGYYSNINEQITIPDNVKEGKYKMYLWMPDKYESIANDPRYAVRMANKDLWDENTGYNDLKAEITISKSASKDPGNLPEGIEETNDDLQAARPRKVLENGILFVVMPDGRKYNVMGY